MTTTNTKTVVQKHYSRQFNGKNFYTFEGADGKKYGTKTVTPPPIGAYVQFDYITNPKGYLEVQGKWEVLPQVERVPERSIAHTAVKAASALNKDDYWGNREARDLEYQERQKVTQATIELQSCRNTAVELVKVLLERELVPVPKAKADQEEFVIAMLNRYTNLFLEQNHSNKDKNNNASEVPAPEATTDEPGTADDSDSKWA